MKAVVQNGTHLVFVGDILKPYHKLFLKNFRK